MNTNSVSAPASVSEKKPMTRREVYNAVLGGNTSEEVLNWFRTELSKMDTANEKRKTQPSKKDKENQPIKESIFTLLSEKGSMVASAIGETLNISTSKASALCRQMVEDGRLSVAEVKSTKKGGGKVKQYTAIKVEDEDDGEETVETVEGAIVIEVEEEEAISE